MGPSAAHRPVSAYARANETSIGQRRRVETYAQRLGKTATCGIRGSVLQTAQRLQGGGADVTGLNFRFSAVLKGFPQSH